MNKPINYLLGLLVFLGCGLFAYGIGQACILSWSPNNSSYDMASFLTSSVTSIAAILSTNLGAVLGITFSTPDSNSRFKRNESENWNPISFFKDPNQTNIQIIACYVYILSLIVAGIVWAHRDFITETNKIVPLIPDLTKSLLGVIVGVLAISLNTKE